MASTFGVGNKNEVAWLPVTRSTESVVCERERREATRTVGDENGSRAVEALVAEQTPKMRKSSTEIKDVQRFFLS